MSSIEWPVFPNCGFGTGFEVWAYWGTLISWEFRVNSVTWIHSKAIEHVSLPGQSYYVLHFGTDVPTCTLPNVTLVLHFAPQEGPPPVCMRVYWVHPRERTRPEICGHGCLYFTERLCNGVTFTVKRQKLDRFGITNVTYPSKL